MITVINSTGVSPFAYHEGMQLMKEAENRNVTFDYFKSCITNGMMSDLRYKVLTLTYRYSYLNRNMLGRLTGENERKLSDCIAWLVKHGFLIRYYISYGTRFTPYFYGVGSGVETYMYRIHADTTPHLKDAASAIFLLSRNQFICAERESDRFTDDTLHTMIPVNEGRKELDIGYSAVIRSSTSACIRVICVPVRRGEGPDDVSTRLKLALCRREQKGFAVPVCVCEDVIHVRELGSAFRKDAALDGTTILFCTDLATFGEDINGNLYGLDMSDPDVGIEEIALK